MKLAHRLRKQTRMFGSNSVQTTRRGLMTAALFGVVAVATWAYSPRAVKAHTLVLPQELLSVAPMISSSIFITADIAYGVQGRWLPPGWAITQIVLGAMFNAGVASVHIKMQHQFHEHNDSIVGLSVFHIAFATWFLAHSVLSLILYEPSAVNAVKRKRTSDDEAEDKQAPEATIDWGITPIESGAMGVLSVRL